MKTNPFLAQLEKDFRRIAWPAILWSVALVLYSALGSPWFLAWAGEGWTLSEILTWNGVLALIATLLVFAFPVLLLGGFYEDPPLRPTSFHRTRPVGALALTLSQTCVLLALSVVAPLAGALASGGGWKAVLGYMPGLLAIGTLLLGAASLTTRWSVLLRGFLLLILVLFVVQFLGGLIGTASEKNLGMDWRPEAGPRAWWALPVAVVGIATLYLQYRYARPLAGLLVLVGGLAVVLGLILWIRPVADVSHEVEGISSDDIEVSLTQPGRGGYNDIPYVGISLAWAVPSAPEGVGVAMIGTRTRVRGAPLRWEQGSSGFDDRGAMAVEAWGLTAAAGSDPRRQSLILRIPTDRLSELIVTGASFETTAWFRVVRFGPPTVFERPARGSARIGDGFFHLLEWKEKTPNGLGIRFFWLSQGSDDLPAVVLVGPEGREWARRGGSSYSGSSFFGRTARSGEFDWSSTSQSKKIDGEWVQVPTPDREWFAGSRIWVGKPEEMGVIRKTISFPVDLLSPDGRWWAFPIAVSPNHTPDVPEVSFVNLGTGDITQVFLRNEPRKPDRFEWADGDTLLFERSDGTVRAIDLKKREGFGQSTYGSDTREATEEERSRAFSANG